MFQVSLSLTCWPMSVGFQKSHFPLVLKGYSEDGGAHKGDVIPEHEFAVGPVCLDDENEFPPVGNQSNWPNLHSH